MALVNVKCPYCKSEKVVAYGKNANGTKRYKCKNEECPHIIFQLEYKYEARKPGVADRIEDMAMNGSGTRDTARVLGVDKNTVTRHLRKLGDRVQYVNLDFLNSMSDKQIDVLITSPTEDRSEAEDNEKPGMARAGGVGLCLGAEMDEQWSWVGDKHHQCWLWWAVDHKTNTPLAFTFGTHEHTNLDVLLALLEPFKIDVYYTDNHFAYRTRIKGNQLQIGKRNTQKIERNHLTLRIRIKRLARKTICFSKRQDIHEAVIGTFINRYFFKRTEAA